MLGAERGACCESQCAPASVLCFDGDRWTQVFTDLIFYLVVILPCFSSQESEPKAFYSEDLGFLSGLVAWPGSRMKT